MTSERVERTTKFVHVGDFIAEVDVALIFDAPGNPGWGPYLSSEDGLKLDRVRDALEKGEIAVAAREAKVYRVQQVAAE